MSVHVVYALVGSVIYSFQNLFVNNDCISFVVFFHLLTVNRIETAKNNFKAEFEFSVKDVDVKQKDWSFLVKIFDSKHKEFQQAFAKRKRFSDIWASFDRRENDLSNQEIRTLRVLDEIDPPAGLNESEPVGSEEISINDYPELLDFDFSQFLGRFDFSSIPISAFTKFEK